MESKIKISVHLDPKVLEKIDEIRGVHSRSSFVNDALYWGFVASVEELDKTTGE